MKPLFFLLVFRSVFRVWGRFYLHAQFLCEVATIISMFQMARKRADIDNGGCVILSAQQGLFVFLFMIALQVYLFKHNKRYFSQTLYLNPIQSNGMDPKRKTRNGRRLATSTPRYSIIVCLFLSLFVLFSDRLFYFKYIFENLNRK